MISTQKNIGGFESEYDSQVVGPVVSLSSKIGWLIAVGRTKLQHDCPKRRFVLPFAHFKRKVEPWMQKNGQALGWLWCDPCLNAFDGKNRRKPFVFKRESTWFPVA